MPRAKVLVVDDEPGVLRTVERILAAPCDVHAFGRPSLALAAAQEEPFELAILDIRMPEMDGFELMSRLGAIQPDVEVIFMTGSTDERDARLVRAIRERAFFFLTKPFDREVLLTLVQRCLEAHRLDMENRAHVERLERELRAAQVFQQSLLPERTAATEEIELAFHYEPCGELCGDFCDYVLQDGAPGALIVSDVSGHGAPAAMLTGMIKQVFHDAGPESFAPGVILERIVSANRMFGYGKHLTAFCARIHSRSGTLEYVSAGHPPGLLLRSEGALALLESSAPLIHPLLPDWHWEQRVVPIHRGDRLFLYTDGLIEAMSSSGEEFGLERLQHAVGRCGERQDGNEGGAFLSAIRRELRSFTEGRPLGDDLTLLVARCR